MLSCSQIRLPVRTLSDHVVPYPGIIGIGQLQAMVSGPGDHIIVGTYIGDLLVRSPTPCPMELEYKNFSDLYGAYPALDYKMPADGEWLMSFSSSRMLEPEVMSMPSSPELIGIVANDHIPVQVISQRIPMAGNASSRSSTTGSPPSNPQ